MDESTQGSNLFTEVGLQRAGQGSTLCPHGQFPGSHSRSFFCDLYYQRATSYLDGFLRGGFVLQKIPWGHFFIKQPTNRFVVTSKMPAARIERSMTHHKSKCQCARVLAVADEACARMCM